MRGIESAFRRDIAVGSAPPGVSTLRPHFGVLETDPDGYSFIKLLFLLVII